MYGETGKRLSYAAKRHNTDRETMERIHNATIGELRRAVQAYESLGWWRRFWLLILEIFGKRKPIISTK